MNKLNYNKQSILNWFHRSLGVNKLINNEVQTYCPICFYENFYFNLIKQVGICHKASCNYRPTLQNLIDIVGFAPEELGYYENKKEEIKPIITLPGLPILKLEKNQLLTNNQYAYEYLKNRNLTDKIILNWGLTCDGIRIYIPIYHEGELISWNARDITGTQEKKYLLAPGSKPSRTILGWSECKLWDKLVLVENSFVSLWLRDLNCSTLFGSNLSNDQLNLIVNSKIKSVAILWDEGADKNAERAVTKLREKGISAAYGKIKGQPDNYDKQIIIEWIEGIFNIVKLGNLFIKL